MSTIAISHREFARTFSKVIEMDDMAPGSISGIVDPEVIPSLSTDGLNARLGAPGVAGFLRSEVDFLASRDEGFPGAANRDCILTACRTGAIMRVFVSELKRGVTLAIKRELRRRSAVEPVIDHLEGDHRMDRNFLIGTEGDAANAVLAAIGYNFARLLAWLRQLWRALLTSLAALILAFAASPRSARASTALA